MKIEYECSSHDFKDASLRIEAKSNEEWYELGKLESLLACNKIKYTRYLHNNELYLRIPIEAYPKMS